jgi:hypothetical protein
VSVCMIVVLLDRPVDEFGSPLPGEERSICCW